MISSETLICLGNSIHGFLDVSRDFPLVPRIWIPHDATFSLKYANPPSCLIEKRQIIGLLSNSLDQSPTGSELPRNCPSQFPLSERLCAQWIASSSMQEIKKSTHEIQSLHPEVYRTLLFHVRFKSSIVLGTMQWIRRATLKTVERSTWLVELGLQWFVLTQTVGL